MYFLILYASIAVCHLFGGFLFATWWYEKSHLRKEDANNMICDITRDGLKKQKLIAISESLASDIAFMLNERDDISAEFDREEGFISISFLSE